MPGGWIATASADHVAVAAREGIFLCSHGSGSAAARPARGDRFVYYAPRERLGAGATVQAFVALGAILDDAPSPHRLDGFEAAVRRAAYEAAHAAPVRPLLGDLSFVTDPRHWGLAFRRGLFRVGAEDFSRIEAAMRDG